MKKRLICVLVICMLLCGCTPDHNTPEPDPAPFDFDVLNKEEPENSISSIAGRTSGTRVFEHNPGP